MEMRSLSLLVHRKAHKSFVRAGPLLDLWTSNLVTILWEPRFSLLTKFSLDKMSIAGSVPSLATLLLSDRLVWI